MEIYNAPIILLCAFILDLVIGDPVYGYHPVRVMGNCINLLLKKLKSIRSGNRLTGIYLAVSVILFFILLYSFLFLLFNKIHPVAGFLLNVYFVYSFIALKDLFKHCGPVTDALRNEDLKEAREAIGMIVGRDVNYLDVTGIIRAAIETLAENFVDGFLSPVFWYSAGCLIGMALNLAPGYSGVVLLITFKGASTLDSMAGYKTVEFREIGWAGARLDDLMNFIPARLSLFILFSGAAFSGLDSFTGLRISLRDRLKHESPNSAHPESFVAGAVRARLGGPTRYADGLKDKPWLGEEYPDPDSGDIRRVIKLLYYSSWLTVAMFLSVLYIV